MATQNKAEKASLMERAGALGDKLAKPMAKIANINGNAAVQEGLVAITPIIIVSCIFIVLYTLATPVIGTSGEPLLPFLAPYADALAGMHGLLIGCMSLYGSLAVALAYAKRVKVDNMAAAILGVASFLVININGDFTSANFGATGLITAMIIGVWSVKIYKILINHNVSIRLPENVPANVFNAFASLVPYIIILTFLWIIRSLLNFDFTTWLSGLLAPVISGGDNAIFFVFTTTAHGFFWSVGIHFDNMINAVLTPLLTIWTQANLDAFLAGQEMPYIFTETLRRASMIPAIFYAPLILMLISKKKQLKTLGAASLIPAIFGITEPITFGLLVFNPYFLIPMTVSGFVSGIIGYGATALGLVNKVYLTVPWATPVFVSGPVASGDWRYIILIIVEIAVGLVIYYPFWKSYEKSLDEQENEKLSEVAEANE